MGRRRSRSRGGLSRRRFLAGGLLCLGGASLLGGTQAFSQVDATRAASVQTAGDEDALLGVDPVKSVQQGDEGVDLVTLTNNTDETLSMTVTLDDPDQGQLTNATPTLASDQSATVEVDVSSDSPTGAGAMPFSVSATETGDGDFTVSLERTVAVAGGPTLTRYVQDRSGDSSATYDVNFDVDNVPDFDRIEIFFENLQNGYASDTLTSTSRDAQISYDAGGGTFGDPYRITIDVYDGSGVVINDVIEDDADGSNPGTQEPIRDEDDPILESFDLTDNTLYNNTELQVEYTVSQLDHFDYVSVTFLNQDQDWATETIDSQDEPTGTLTHTSGGTEGDTYDITVEVHNDEGMTVDSGTIEEYVAGSADSASWP